MSSPATPYEVQKHDVLYSSTTSYRIIDFSGEGSFGKVAKCIDLTTGSHVAVKIHKNKGKVSEVTGKELNMLQVIRTLDPDKNNIVNFMEDFMFNNLSCLAFEMLDRSLWDLIMERKRKPLTLNEIRPVTHQLMIAFDALKSIGIMHADLKPDNIMLVNHKDQPFKIKLIDFGLARRVSLVPIGTIIQPLSFRAPEVTLGLPLTEAVDMWGVGCVMAFLYFGRGLFPSKCSYNLIRRMVHLLGQPKDDLLSAGVYSWAYFSQNEDPNNPGFRLRSPEEFTQETGIQTKKIVTDFDLVEDLQDAVKTYPAKIKRGIEYHDRMAFLKLLMSILDLNPETRLTPRDCLNKPFLTMSHLKKRMHTSSYLHKALQCMTVSPVNHLNSEPKLDEKNYKSEPQAIEADLNEPSLHLNEACLEKRPSATGHDLPQVDHVELQVAHIVNEQTFTNELQAEKDRNKLLQEELERLRISYQLLIARCEDDALKNRRQAAVLQCDLDIEILQKKQLQIDFDEATTALQQERKKNKALQNQLNKKVIQNTLCQKMEEEITVLQQNAREMEKTFVKELDELKTQLTVQTSRNLKLSNELKAKREALRKIATHDDGEQQKTISPAPALECQKAAEGNLPQKTAEPPSVWKRARHFLGLRKPRSWKRRREEK